MSVPLWEPGTQYNYGDIVEYRTRYKITRPHRSQQSWAPPMMPALWDRIPESEWHSHGSYNPPHGNGNYNSQDVHQPDDCSWHPNQTVIVTHEEQKKRWRDLGDDRRKQLKTGGGLLVGTATIDAGYHAWDERKGRSEEEKQARTWGLQRWQRDAYVRTEEFRNCGPRGPCTWVLVDGREKIPTALEAGKDKDGHPIYIARAYYEDSIQMGRASRVFRKGCVISYDGRAIELNKFEVLIGDPRAVRWVRHSSNLSVQQLGARPVEGGREANGVQLYVARVRYNDGVHAAKCGEHLPGAHLAFSGTEVIVKDYEVLCLN